MLTTRRCFYQRSSREEEGSVYYVCLGAAFVSLQADCLFLLFRYVPAYKLVDVPELGYTTSDKPYPRGELRIKTKRMITGYYKHPEVRLHPECALPFSCPRQACV